MARELVPYEKNGKKYWTLGGLWNSKSGKSISCRITDELIENLSRFKGEFLIVSPRNGEKKNPKWPDHSMTVIQNSEAATDFGPQDDIPY